MWEHGIQHLLLQWKNRWNIKKCLQQAQKNEEKGIYYDAILEYKKALEYDGDNRNIYMKIAEDYRNMGDDSGFVDACNSAISLDGDNEQAILTLADYYVEQDGETGRHLPFMKKTHQEEKKQWRAEGKAGFSGRRFPVYRR